MKEELETRQRILQAARGLFFRHGFSKVTMDEVAGALAVSKKTLYKHFPGKEELLRECTLTHLEEIQAHFQEIYRDSGTDVVEKLRRHTALCTGLYGRMSGPLIDDLKRCSPELWHEVNEHRRCSIQDNFGSLIRKGCEEGIFRSDIDAGLFLTIYLAVMERVLNPETLSQIPFTPSQAFDACVKIMFEGLFTQEGRNRYYAEN